MRINPGPDPFGASRLRQVLSTDLRRLGRCDRRARVRAARRNGRPVAVPVLLPLHRCVSLIVTTNLPFAKWTQVFRDETMTTALVDRLTHRVSGPVPNVLKSPF